jgi:antitoxin component YwqK of YwqJK toxin-antitoxin module
MERLVNSISAIVSILILLTFCNCSHKKPNKAGIIWEKFENGKPKIEYRYLTDTADISDGYYYLEYYSNGNIKIEGLEKNKVKNGKWNYYFQNGKIKASFIIQNDTLNGPIVLYNKDGNIEEIDKIKNGLLQQKKLKIIHFLNEELNITGQTIVYFDSLNIKIDTLKKIIDKK